MPYCRSATAFNGEIISVSALSPIAAGKTSAADSSSKYDHSRTFGIVTSGTSNTLWAPDENAGKIATRSSGAGRAIVGADEEVLCWDVKKGELLSRWKDSGCSSEVTTIAQSEADPDIYAVGYGSLNIPLRGTVVDRCCTDTVMEVLESGILG